MQLYCRNGVVIATHADDQSLPANAYGDGVRIIPFDGDLSRIGPVPDAGQPDLRPFAEPAATVDLLVAYAAAQRYVIETSGIAVSGMAVKTDRESQAMITGAYMRATGDAEFATQWKGANGSFVALNAAQVIAVGEAVALHVANCFSLEAEAVAKIQASQIETFDAVDSHFNI